MASDDIRISVEVDTGDSAAKLEQVRDASQDTGEQLDKLDAKTVEVDVDVDADRAAESIKRVGSEADGSKDALANMVGNTTGELGELAGVGGVAGQALGQVAEYAADGRIGLKALAATGPAIAGLGLLMYGLEQRAKNAAERMEQAKESTEALSRVADAEVLNEFGRAVANAAIGGEDLDSILRQMAEDNLPGYRRALDLAEQSGSVSAETLRAMRDALAAVEGEMAQQERTSEQYGDNLAGAAEGAADLTAELPTLIEPLGNVEGAMAGAAEATSAFERAADDLLGLIDDEQAWLNAQDAVEDYVRSLGDSEASTRDQERAYLSAAEALIRYVQGLEGVPDEVRTEVLAAINEGDLGKAYALLDELTRTRTVRVNIATGAITGALAGIFAGQSLNVRTTSAGTGGAQAVNVTNYYPPRVSPTEQFRAQRTYERVYGG